MIEYEKDGLRLRYEKLEEEKGSEIEVIAGFPCRVRVGSTLCFSQCFFRPLTSSSPRVTCDVEIAPGALGVNEQSANVYSLAVERAVSEVILRLPKVKLELKVVVLSAANGNELVASMSAASLALAVKGIECSHLLPQCRQGVDDDQKCRRIHQAMILALRKV